MTSYYIEFTAFVISFFVTRRVLKSAIEG